MHLATLAFPSAENFSYRHTFVHNGFYHRFYIIISSIISWERCDVCQRSACPVELGKTVSLLRTKTIIFFRVLVNFEILKQCYFVNAHGKYFEGKIFTNGNWSWNSWKIFPLKTTHYVVQGSYITYNLLHLWYS